MSAQVLTILLIAGAIAAEPLGLPASIEQFPSLAQVEFYEATGWLQRCTATVITNRHVLTAAKCFVDVDPALRRVRAGTSTRGVNGQVLGVEAVTIHPDFGTLDYDADIAVIRLEDYLIVGDSVQQAPILGQGIELPGGLVVKHAGWGTTAEGSSESSEELFAVNLTVNSHMSCMIQYISSHYISENMICIGLQYTRGRDLDVIDIGAPSFYEDTMVSLFSFGRADAADEFPAVATSVGSFTTWIIETAQ